MLCALQISGGNGFKDVNTYAQHFHGLWGNPGTNNVPCDGALHNGSLFCMRGDNVFADVAPKECGEWQYDVAPDHAPGSYWCALQGPSIRVSSCELFKAAISDAQQGPRRDTCTTLTHQSRVACEGHMCTGLTSAAASM